MKQVILGRFVFPMVVFLICGFITWLFSIQSRVTANEYNIKNASDVIIEIKADTSSILCRIGEQSRCR